VNVEKERILFMKRKIVSIITLTMLLTSMLMFAFHVQPIRAQAEGTIYIAGDGSINPPTAPISTADNITYTLTDNIISDINWNPVLIVEKNNTVIDGSGFAVENLNPLSHYGITLSMRSNVTIKNMSIAGCYYGIYLHDGTSNVTIQNTRVEASGAGIWLSASSNNSVTGNTVIAGGSYGIWLSDYANFNSITGNTITNSRFCIDLSPHCYNNIISRNIVANSTFGIGLGYSSNNILSGNTIANNSAYGIGLYSSNYTSVNGNTFTDSGLYVWSSYSNVVENNTVNGGPLVYLEGVADQSVEDAGQVVLVRCDRITVEGLNLYRASYGIELWETDDSTISGNNITANGLSGVGLSFSSGNSISGNNIANSHYGINLASNYGVYTYNNSISGNNITFNDCGIWVQNSSGNRLYHNNIIFNIQQVSISPFGYANAWDDGYPSGGNYWSDYNGNDADHDGIGDTAYVIDADNIDRYPLMTQYDVIPEFSYFLIELLFFTATTLAFTIYRRKHHSNKAT